MGVGFKEVAYLRSDDNKFKENFDKIDWSGAKSDNENHIVNKLIEDTYKKADDLKTIAETSYYENNTISLIDGDLTISHDLDENKDFVFTIEDKRGQRQLKVDSDTFNIMGEGLGLLADTFITMYFEIAHRNHIEELENQK